MNGDEKECDANVKSDKKNDRKVTANQNDIKRDGWFLIN